jgi:hypothetical protein
MRNKMNKRVLLSVCVAVAAVITVMSAVLLPGNRSKAKNDDDRWIEAYRSFLEEPNSYANIMSTQNSAGMQGFITGFYLNDIDDDGIPELLINKYMTAEYIYAYENEAVCLKSIMPYDENENSINMVNVSDGRLYTYAYIGNDGDIQAVRLYKISFGKNDASWENSDINVINNGKVFLYQDNITDDSGIDADVENTISKRKYSRIYKKLVPAQFKEINQENLDKYLTVNYMGTDVSFRIYQG